MITQVVRIPKLRVGPFLTLGVSLLLFAALAPPAGAQSFSVLYNFLGAPNDGAVPFSSLTADSSGNLYGTTESGGPYGAGTVFELPATGGEIVLYSFTGGVDGDIPTEGLVRDESGNFYGTTLWGGNTAGICPRSAAGCGVVFKLTPDGQETVLYNFTGGADGAYPSGSLIRDAAGNLYGTTGEGARPLVAGWFSR